jgi:2',3'-cyclic-nucleotide 2'-phosphodiesterase (5'-nucleotidase family)
VIGEKDLGFGLDFIVSKSSELGLPVVLSNLRYAGTGELVFPPSKIAVLPSGLKVGLIGVMSPRLALPPQVDAGSVRITDPLEAVGAEMETLGATVDVIVVVAHLSRREAEDLARKFPGIDVVVHGHEGRPVRKTKRFGQAYLLQAAKEGQYMGVAFAVLNQDRKIRRLVSDFERLSDRYVEDEAIAGVFRSYGMSLHAQEKEVVPRGRP